MLGRSTGFLRVCAVVRRATTPQEAPLHGGRLLHAVYVGWHLLVEGHPAFVGAVSAGVGRRGGGPRRLGVGGGSCCAHVFCGGQPTSGRGVLLGSCRVLRFSRADAGLCLPCWRHRAFSSFGLLHLGLHASPDRRLLGVIAVPSPTLHLISPHSLLRRGTYVGIHSAGFKDFLLKPELLRAIQVRCTFWWFFLGMSSCPCFVANWLLAGTCVVLSSALPCSRALGFVVSLFDI